MPTTLKGNILGALCCFLVLPHVHVYDTRAHDTFYHGAVVEYTTTQRDFMLDFCSV